MTNKNYEALARAIVACGSCINSNNSEWQARWEKHIAEIVDKYFPHGSGFDTGTKLDVDENLKHNGARLVFTTAFHHMNDNGMYDGWTSHVITVYPDLSHGYTLKISGRNRHEIKEYIHEMFSSALSEDCTLQA